MSDDILKLCDEVLEISSAPLFTRHIMPIINLAPSIAEAYKELHVYSKKAHDLLHESEAENKTLQGRLRLQAKMNAELSERHAVDLDEISRLREALVTQKTPTAANNSTNLRTEGKQ